MTAFLFILKLVLFLSSPFILIAFVKYCIRKISGMIRDAVARKRFKKFCSYLSNIENFSPTRYLLSAHQKTGIAFDENSNLLCLVTIFGEYSHYILPYRDIIATELFEYDDIVGKSNGMVFGGLGLGVYSGKSTASPQTYRIDLEITINNLDYPLHTLNFLNTTTTRGSGFYNEQMNEARYWHGVFRVIIANESEAKRLAYHYNPQFFVKNDSVPDEIQKLGDIRRQGLLTEDEFEQRKEKLLN
jgi:hypothetical protein